MEGRPIEEQVPAIVRRGPSVDVFLKNKLSSEVCRNRC